MTELDKVIKQRVVKDQEEKVNSEPESNDVVSDEVKKMVDAMMASTAKTGDFTPEELQKIGIEYGKKVPSPTELDNLKGTTPETKEPEKKEQQVQQKVQQQKPAAKTKLSRYLNL
jgi:hypothetical protein